MVKNTHHILLVLLLMGSLPFAVEAQQQNQQQDTQRPDRPYDVLLVKSAAGKEIYNEDPNLKPAGDNQVEVVDPKTGDVVFSFSNRHRYPVEAMEWALSKAHVTALVEGNFTLHSTLRVPVSNTSLIVGPNAELSVTDAYIQNPPVKPRPDHKPIIKVIRQDHVNVFHLGTVTADWEIQMDKPRTDKVNPGWGAVMFDGRNRGKTGINGGLLFGTGTLNNMGMGYILVDTANVKVPLLWGKNFWSTLLMMEGNEDTEIDLIAGLRTDPDMTPVSYVTNEVIDLNSINRRTRIHHLIGTWLDGQEEFLDVNSSPKTIVDRLNGYGKVDQSIEELIGDKGNFVDIHAYHPPHTGWALSQKPFDQNNSPGTEIKNVQKIDKNVKTWKTEVKTPGFPDNLPVLKINVRLTAVFEDGSTEQVFSNKYRYDLTNAENPSGK